MRENGMVSLLVFAVIAGATGVGAVAGGEPVASRQPSGTDAVAVASFSGGGMWRTGEEKSGAGRPWRIHVLRDGDGAVRAKVSLPGESRLDGAQVEAQVMGREAFGVLLDEQGAQIGTFNATLWGAGAGGSFTMGDGRSGVWQYDAGTKAEVVRMEAAVVAEPAASAADAAQ